MDTRKRPVRPLSIGKPVYQGRADKPVPAVSGRVPAHIVAPNRNSTGKSQGPPDTRPVLHIALVIPLAKYVNFTKWVKDNIRIVKPKDWGGEVVLTVLPDLGDELIDLDQYEIPTLNVIKPEGSLE